jgi:protein involved in polysaccharide export with SLBB domain
MRHMIVLSMRPLFATILWIGAFALPLQGQETADSTQPAGFRPTSVSYGSASLGPGDGVRITIYRQPDASGEYMVDEAGFLVLPLVGEVQVAGKSVARLEEEMVRRYREFFRDPIILITPLYRINVLGAVAKAGLYPVDPTMTISDLLAQAGGLAPNGSYKKIHMLRGGSEQQLDLSNPAKRAQEVGQLGLRSGDQIVVGEKGRAAWEWVPVAASILGLTTTIIAVTN